ncbi:MAG: hypothetical protein KME31_23370 [Tolypothrix carrinoi HA7290-LM1]|nr:hypothetical protein [Tolypothrix carrinoi HA7290-LM1]
MGNGHRAMGIKKTQERNARTIRGFFLCPMPHDGRCSTQVIPKTALPPPCPMTAGAPRR